MTPSKDWKIKDCKTESIHILFRNVVETKHTVWSLVCGILMYLVSLDDRLALDSIIKNILPTLPTCVLLFSACPVCMVLRVQSLSPL